MLEQLAADQVDVLEAGLRRPTLDDVFLSLTGHAAEDAADASADDDSGTPDSATRHDAEVTR